MIVDYIAAASLITGYILIGAKKSKGWAFSLLGNALYLGVGIKTGLFGMAALSAVMSIIALVNWARWQKAERFLKRGIRR